MQVQVEAQETRATQWAAAAPSTERARLYLSGVATPVVTRVRERHRDHLTVEQALPFLQLESQVYDGEFRVGRIASVDVKMNRGVPHLVVRLTYDEPDPAAALSEATPHDTLPGTLATVACAPEPPAGPSRRDPTKPFELQTVRKAREVSVGSARLRSARGDETTLVFRTDCLRDGEPRVAPPSLLRRSRARAVVILLSLLGLARRIGISLSARLRSIRT